MRWDYTQGNSGRESPIPIIDSAAQVWLLEPTFATMKDPSNVFEGSHTCQVQKQARHTRDFGKQGALFYLLVIELISLSGLFLCSNSRLVVLLCTRDTGSTC